MEINTMSESGVDLDFDGLLDDDLTTVGNFYELTSKPVVGSPQTEVKHAPEMMRTKLKQQLMRQHEMQQEQQKKSQQSAVPATLQSSSAVQIASQIPSELPAQVLKVRPLLENPTRHHVQQTRKRQVQEYVSTRMGKPDNNTTQSLPNAIATANHSLNMGHPLYVTTGSSAPVDPDSDGPLSVGLSSTATSVDDMELLGDILTCNSFDMTMDEDLQHIEPSLAQMSHTLPPKNTFLDHRYNNSSSSPTHASVGGPSSTSCPADIVGHTKQHGGRQRQGNPPPFLTTEETKHWFRERQKKDSHNIIEKRRRLNINDKIKELGEILPRTSDTRIYSDTRANKGSILKASVDYIYTLRKDQDKLRHMEEKQKQLELTNRRMLLKMQEMEMLMQAHGLSGSSNSSSSQQMLTDVIKQSMPGSITDLLKQEAQPLPHATDMMDDTSPVHGDPMMSASSSDADASAKGITMDDISEMLL